MNRRLRLIIGVLCVSAGICVGQGSVSHTKTLTLMGCSFNIKAVADTDQHAWDAINAGIDEITRIEDLISSWDPNSQTTAIVRQAGISPVKVDFELIELIDRSMKISNLTNGAFDISFGSMTRIYKFDRKEHTFPDEKTITKAKSLIDFNNIIIDRKASTVFLKEKGMKIGFGGIGKGYAANKAKEIMQLIPGVVGGIVNASGDLSIWGSNSDEENVWNIKVLDPEDVNKVLLEIPVNNTSVVTSGDYEKYFTNEGKRYSHIIDPKSGIPSTGIKSVTIICKDAELADGLATSVTILGIEDGLYLVNQLHGVEALLVTDENEILYSDNVLINHSN